MHLCSRPCVGDDPQRYHELNETLPTVQARTSLFHQAGDGDAPTSLRSAALSSVAAGHLPRSQVEQESILDTIGTAEGQAALAAMRRHIYGDDVVGNRSTGRLC
jgi:hypothetical protein